MISNSDVVKRQPEGAVFPSDWDNFDQLVSDVYVAWSVQCEMENWEKLGASHGLHLARLVIEQRNQNE